VTAAPAPGRALAVAVALGLLAVAGACRPVNPTEDARIEAEIKARLVAETNANLTRLGVLSSSGVVYLSGTVASADERARAETLARGVRGVTRVINTLEVRAE
jgi:hyperosmotically inducible periplasmic protein